jgi:hypothetical protein
MLIANGSKLLSQKLVFSKFTNFKLNGDCAEGFNLQDGGGSHL